MMQRRVLALQDKIGRGKVISIATKTRASQETIALLRKEIRDIQQDRNRRSGQAVSEAQLGRVMRCLEELSTKMSGVASEGQEFTFRLGGEAAFLRNLASKMSGDNMHITGKEMRRVFSIHEKYFPHAKK